MSEEVKQPTTDTPASEDPKVEVNPYEEELNRLKGETQKKETQIGQAEHVIETLKKEKKELEEKLKNVPTIDLETVESLLNEKTSQLKQDLQKDKYQELLAKEASDPKERELMEYILQNKIKSSGDIAEDIKTAKLLANANRIQANFQEINRAQNSNQSKGNYSSSSELINGVHEDKPNLSRKDSAFMKAAQSFAKD